MSVKSLLRESTVGRIAWPVLKKYQANIKSIKRKINVKKMTNQAMQKDKHIFYCGVCESSNMGDMAQTYCTLKWMKTAYPEYDIVFCRTSVFRDPKCHLIDAMRKIMKEDDIIFFQSGYNTHDLGDGREDLMHQQVIRAFPDTRTIMLPQTVYFQKDDRKKKCAEVYNAHKRMLFFARDPISETYAKEMFPDLCVKLYPDIVTSLIGYTDSATQRKGIFLCRRKDVEQYYQEEEYRVFATRLQRFDNDVIVADTIISASNAAIFSQLDKYVHDMIDYFGSFRLVVTDKYHGLIFALAANTPVIVLKTKDHKVTSGYEWFSKVYPNRIFFAEDEKGIVLTAEKILKDPHYDKLDFYFDREYYQKLKKEIDEWSDQLGNL